MNRDVNKLKNIRYVVGVGSGKGGVGKSTVACNLAVALRRLGMKVGLLDADLYGPSVPKIMGTEGMVCQVNELGMLMPVVSLNGVLTASFGYFTQDSNPVIWRGPMISKALNQLIDDVAWGDLDILVIDLPPGTGDIQLTLIERKILDAVLIVSTPQDVAVIDAKKAFYMFRKSHVPVLGFVCNMSYFECSKCSERHEIFAGDALREFSRETDVPIVLEIPLKAQIRELSDLGMSIAELGDDDYQWPHLIAELVAGRLSCVE